ncbi:MAG: hypothetical protein U0798_13555 [Gemmataceae bacterium]
MPPPRPRRPDPDPADDPGYEVVETPPKRMAKPISASQPKPKPRPVVEESDDPGYEVVERPAAKPKKKAIVAVEEDDDEVDDDRDRRDRRNRQDRDDDDQPTRSRKKKKRSRRSETEDEEKSFHQAWWFGPVVLIIIGLVLSFVGAAGTAAGKKHAVEAIGTGIMLVGAFIQFVVTIPLSIVALIIGGKICGIEYGTPLQAVANIAAISSMMMGLDWILEWVGLWYSAIHVITFLVGFSLFMTLFQLDHNEVWISLFFMKIVTVVSFFRNGDFVHGGHEQNQVAR